MVAIAPSYFEIQWNFSTVVLRSLIINGKGSKKYGIQHELIVKQPTALT